MAWRNTPPQMQEHLPHCKLFFPKSSALMVMVTPRSLQLAQPPPVPYLGVISCYRQKAIHLRVCRPASTYASTSMCTHIYTGAHTRAHLHASCALYQKLREIREAFTRIPQVYVLQSTTEQASLCILKWRKEECFLRDYYNHHHCHSHHLYLLIMMVLII